MSPDKKSEMEAIMQDFFLVLRDHIDHTFERCENGGFRMQESVGYTLFTMMRMMATLVAASEMPLDLFQETVQNFFREMAELTAPPTVKPNSNLH